MIGPAVLLLVTMIGGALLGGWAGAVVGAFVTVAVVASVALGAASWARRIGVLLEPQEVRDLAPCPPGFSRVCGYVYRRTLPGRDG